MKRVAIFTLFCSAVVFAADYKDVNRTVALSGNGSVEIETHKGSIKVSTWDRQEVEIHARIEAEPGSIMDRRRFDGTDVQIDAAPDSVRIKTYYPNFDWCCDSDTGNNPEVRYTIQMPKTAQLIIHDHRSDTEVTGLQGSLTLSTHRGSAHLNGLGGALHVDTHRGDIQADFSAFTANSSVKNFRGTVEVSMPRSSRINLETDLGRRGAIDTDFPVMTRTISRRGEAVHGAINGGGPTLRIEIERGEVRLHGK